MEVSAANASVSDNPRSTARLRFFRNSFPFNPLEVNATEIPWSIKTAGLSGAISQCFSSDVLKLNA